MRYRIFSSLLAVVLITGAAGVGLTQEPAPGSHPDIRLFFMAIVQDDDRAEEALARIADTWRAGYAGPIWDMLRFMTPPTPPRAQAPAFGNAASARLPIDISRPGADTGGGQRIDPAPPEHPSTKIWRRLMRFLEAQTGERFGGDTRRAHQWIWDQPYDPHPDYALFKGVLYAEIDPRFHEFFPPGAEATIRLDEIDWGGVTPNSIPPLEYPARLVVKDADYLDDDHIVFGIFVNGEARAYPKRILAWHEMALDTIGGVELTIVYCTLCGTVIPYESVVGGQHIVFGTSGLLYRSNKLMFDDATKSLWKTFEGVPVVGPLVGSGIRLRPRSVVTTTWGEWRRMHPETTVLSPETGHQRDYSEGAAYRDYFSTDRLMFDVSRADDRLKNKDEVVVMLLDDGSGVRYPLAIAVDFLDEHRVCHGEHAGRRLVVVTSPDGANRVYDAADVRLARVLDDGRVVDGAGAGWRVTEDALIAEADPNTRLARVAAQRAFWFGWYAQFPETVLIK